jgi:hypothetical protein
MSRLLDFIKQAAKAHYFDKGMDRPYPGTKVVRDHAVTSRVIYPESLITDKKNIVRQKVPEYSKDPFLNKR